MSGMGLAELIRKALDVRLAQLRVAIPARVESYDAATQTADVKPLIKDKLIVEDGEILESLPVIPAVPVAFPRGGGFFISFPIAAGDTGRIVVCDRSIDQWIKRGGEVDPLDLRMHSWAGAVFEPDLADSLHALADADAAMMVLGKDGGPQIRISADAIAMGAVADAVEALAVASKVATQLTNLKTAISNAVVVAQDGGASFKSTLLAALATWPGDVASTKVTGI